jgi:hypothetical protein
LVAAILKEGGLMEKDSNPGSATPELLYRLYKGRAACTGNPYVLRDMQQACGAGLNFSSIGCHNGVAHSCAPSRAYEPHAEERETLLARQSVMAPMAQHYAAAPCGSCAPRSSVAATGAFRQIGGGSIGSIGSIGAIGAIGATARHAATGASPRTAVNLTFNGLTMTSNSYRRQ